jgi:5-methylcytosine-specific restriction endonuclease McrA
VLSAEERRERSREATRRWRAAHLEEARAAVRRYRSENREKFLASNRKSKKKYYGKNRERIIEWQRAYTARNYERLRAGWLRYSAEHREEARRRAKAWWQANHDGALAKLRARSRAYRKDPERIAVKRKWQDDHLDLVRDYLRVSGLRRRARGGPAPTAAEWRAILRRWEHRCAYCGLPGKLEADHRIPLARGGTSAVDNIIPACPHCNRRKHTLTEAEFRLLRLTEEPLDIPYLAGKPQASDPLLLGRRRA